MHFPRLEISGNPSYHYENKFLHYDTEGSKFQYFYLKRGVGIDELCGSRLTPLLCSMIFPVLPGPNPQEDDAKFCEFSKRAEDGPSRASRLSTTFPEVPIVRRVSSVNPESRQGSPLGLEIVKGWLGTWDAPELLAVSGS